MTSPVSGSRVQTPSSRPCSSSLGSLMVSMVSLVIRAGEYSPEDSDAFSGRGLGKPETPPLVELRSFGPGDVPDVALRVAPAEAATPELLLRLLEQLAPG